MISTSRDAVLEEVRQRCDLPPYTTDSPVTTSEGIILATDSLARLGGLLSEVYPEGYQVTQTPLTTSPGVQTVALPSDFERLLRVAWRRDPNFPEIPLALATVDDWDPYPASWSAFQTWLIGAVPSYRVQGSALSLFPTPDQAYTLTCWYVPSLTFTGGTPSVTLRQGWYDWLVCDIAVRVRQRQQKEYTDFATERAQLEQAIRAQARRDTWQPRTVRDVRRQYDRLRAGNRWGRWR